MELYFADHFKINPKILEEYGAFNISLVSDLPLFIDPFLLFHSDKEEYKILHDGIIKYLIFLRDKSAENQEISIGALKAWFVFKEVRQNWFGFSVKGNAGSGLGPDFARELNANLHKIFPKFGEESITNGSHLEKLCLIKDGVGKDNISDFATNLIKEFLLEYTQEFSVENIDKSLLEEFRIQRVHFNYDTEVWEEKTFNLPKFNNDFIILTPRELLTRDETWINNTDLIDEFERIPAAISDDQLRFQINNYFLSKLLPKKDKRGNEKEPTKKEQAVAAWATIQQFPDLIDYYIKFKEQNGSKAESISTEKVVYSENLYIGNVQQFVSGLAETEFYKPVSGSFEEAKDKIMVLKNYIENNDGYKLFYHKAERIKGEKDLQLLFGLVCHESTTFDVNREVNNGRGPVDAKVSKGNADKTLVEFKLASNKKLEQGLQNQVDVYKRANNTLQDFKVIIYFTEEELVRVNGILNKLDLTGLENIILIDGRSDNKPSGSKA
ncbi:MAG: hypothetical protein WD231_02325 [Candidatus Woykebacteria bacterium]